MSKLIFDIESNGLYWEATQVFCLSIYDIDSNGIQTYTQDNMEIGLERLRQADLLIGHNIIMYDLPVLEKLYNIGIPTPNDKIVDTLVISRVLCPDRNGGHSLAAWGQRLGFPKGEFSDFERYSEDMRIYCERDVMVTYKLYMHLRSDIAQYDKVGESLRIEHTFAQLIQKQIQSGFKLDVPIVIKMAEDIDTKKRLLEEECIKALEDFPVRDDSHYNIVKKKGLLIKADDVGYEYKVAGSTKTKFRIFKYKPRSMTSRKQMIDFFIEQANWEPTDFTKNDGVVLNESVLETIYHPIANKMSKLLKYQKDLGMLRDGSNGWLGLVRADGRVHGDVNTNGTSTGRCTHSKPNMSQCAKSLRKAWIAEDGYVLVGVDASSLEFRTFAHYLGRFDNDFLCAMVNGGTDVHTENAKKFNLDNRDAAKTLLYAGMYAGSCHRLGVALAKFYGHDRDYILSIRSDPSVVKRSRGSVEAVFKVKGLGIPSKYDYKLAEFGLPYRDILYETFPQILELIDEVKKVSQSRGHLIGVDGRPLFPRNPHSAFNLLNQSAGAVIMKVAMNLSYKKFLDLGWRYGVDYRYVGNIHDEIQSEVKTDISEVYGQTLAGCITEAAEILKFKCKFAGEYKISKSWAGSH